MRCPVKLNLIGIEVAEHAEITCAKSLQVVGVGLSYVAPGIDLTIERYQHALAARLRRTREPYSIDKVHLGVRAETVIGALRSSDYERLVAMHGQAQKICRLFNRVGPLYIDQSVNVG